MIFVHVYVGRYILLKDTSYEKIFYIVYKTDLIYM